LNQKEICNEKPYGFASSKNKSQLLQLQFTEFDYLQVKQFVCTINGFPRKRFASQQKENQKKICEIFPFSRLHLRNTIYKVHSAFLRNC